MKKSDRISPAPGEYRFLPDDRARAQADYLLSTYGEGVAHRYLDTICNPGREPVVLAPSPARRRRHVATRPRLKPGDTYRVGTRVYTVRSISFGADAALVIATDGDGEPVAREYPIKRMPLPIDRL